MMKTSLCVLLCLCLAVSASARVGTPGHNDSALNRGSYTVAASYAVGLSSAYGLAIQTDVPNSIWISQYSPLVDNEFDMSTGSATGNTWAIYGGVDADDMGYCVYAGSPNQFFFGDWAASSIEIYDASTTGADPFYSKDIAGPSGWAVVCGVDAGHGNLYASDFFTDQIAWGPYTGTESTVTWTTAPFATVSGMSVWENYLFVCCQITGADNIFIFELNPDGSPIMTPIWSCEFIESASSAGGIDFDGTYVWLYPQNDNLYKLDIDWEPSALETDTWGGIKSVF
jgi:hypothetical protein